MSELVLGWKVNENYDPLPFAEKGLSHSSLSDYEKNLVKITPEKLGNHTAIIAQSGSGKSFFLGRLLEEILLNSNINCFVIDPNADYRNFHLLNHNVWENQKITSKNLYCVTHEVSCFKSEEKESESRKRDFEQNWQGLIKLGIKVIRGDTYTDYFPYEKIKLYWPELSADSFISGLNSAEQTDFKLLSYLVQIIGQILWIKYLCGNEFVQDPVEFVFKFFQTIKKTLANYENPSRSYSSGKQGLFHDNLNNHIESNIHLSSLKADLDKIIKKPRLINNLPYILRLKILNNANFDIYSYFQDKLDKTQLVSDEIQSFYENKYRSLSITGMFSSNPLERTKLDKQLCICDLPSFEDKEIRTTVIGQMLENIWQQARFEWSMVMSNELTTDNRKPRIIVIDEAHNLVPIETENSCEYFIREKIRTIAAEGRKYGLFLLLMSQRPDKLDPKVLSECKNVGVMKINNQSIINNISNIFGLEDYKGFLIKSRELDTGRIMLFGDWAKEQGMIFFGAARRTKEGGKKIPEENYQK